MRRAQLEHTFEWLIKGLGPRGGSPSRALSGDRPVVEAEEAMDGLGPVWSGLQLPKNVRWGWAASLEDLRPPPSLTPAHLRLAPRVCHPRQGMFTTGCGRRQPRAAVGERWASLLVASVVLACVAVGVVGLEPHVFTVPDQSSLPPSCADGAYRNADQGVARWIAGCPGYSRWGGGLLSVLVWVLPLATLFQVPTTRLPARPPPPPPFSPDVSLGSGAMVQ